MTNQRIPAMTRIRRLLAQLAGITKAELAALVADIQLVPTAPAPLMDAASTFLPTLDLQPRVGRAVWYSPVGRRDEQMPYDGHIVALFKIGNRHHADVRFNDMHGRSRGADFVPVVQAGDDGLSSQRHYCEVKGETLFSPMDDGAHHHDTPASPIARKVLRMPVALA